jgi:hypothetical protein
MSNHEPTISLQSYAAVLAGLGAGLTLGRALALAEVPAPAWDEASDDWQARIDESAASDLAVLVAFDGALSTARRRFEPTIEPIASDPLAWTQFRRHFVTSVDPVAFLAERDLSLGIQARLEADWTTRVLADAALAATIQGYMDAVLAECPALEVTPSPWLAETGATPAVAPVAPRAALPSIAAVPVASPPVDAVPVVKPSYLLDPPVAPPPQPPPAPRVNAAQELGRTRMVLDVPATAPMPFVRTGTVGAVLPFQGATPAQGAAVSAQPAPRVAIAPRADLGQTMGPILTPIVAPTPFRPADLGQTVGPSLSPVAASTPFRPADPEAMGFTLEKYAALVAARQQSGGATPAFLAQFGLDAERHAALDAYWNRRFAQNGMLALDFGRFVAAATKSPEPVKTAEPVKAVAPVDLPSPLPDLSVEQYAWVVAKLRKAAPESLAATLATLRLTPETREQLEAHWRGRMGRDAALQQAFLAALSRYKKGP